MRLSTLILLAILLFPLAAQAWEARVLSVHDGDTITVQRLDSGAKVKVRLYGIDTPEMPANGWKIQPYAVTARDFVRGIIPVGSRVDVQTKAKDKYKRTVGVVVSLQDGKNVQEELLRSGLAWVYPQYCVRCEPWQSLQYNAKADKKGLWRNDDPVPPWDWRKGKR